MCSIVFLSKSIHYTLFCVYCCSCKCIWCIYLFNEVVHLKTLLQLSVGMCAKPAVENCMTLMYQTRLYRERVVTYVNCAEKITALSGHLLRWCILFALEWQFYFVLENRPNENSFSNIWYNGVWVLSLCDCPDVYAFSHVCLIYKLYKSVFIA